jgi:hypothetical protein
MMKCDGLCCLDIRVALLGGSSLLASTAWRSEALISAASLRLSGGGKGVHNCKNGFPEESFK